MSDETTIINESNYRENLDRATAVVLFYKKLCPNCKALEKMLEKFFAANPEVQFKRIDSEECPQAMKTYDVSRVPTLLILKDGNMAASKVGLMNLREMTDFYRSA